MICKEWMVANCLSLHPRKTECILFGTKRKFSKVLSFDVMCDGAEVKRMTCIKYLGVLLDENLNGYHHAMSQIDKISSRVEFIYRQTPFLKGNSRQILCSALVQPLFDYSSSSWYGKVIKIEF
jgi:hypothetical protein